MIQYSKLFNFGDVTMNNICMLQITIGEPNEYNHNE